VDSAAAQKSFAARAAWCGQAAVPSPALLDKIIRCYVAVAAAAYLIDLLRQTREALTDGAGRPFGDDFVNFWSGAFLALHHRAADVYDRAAFHAFEQSVVGPHLGAFHYSYPPVMLVVTAPLALVAYVPALALWIGLGWSALYGALRLALPGGRGLLFALATPAVFVNAVAGQNGTWSAALFGAGLGLLERQPILAGGLLGLLAVKPQLGLLLPVALIAGHHWRAFAAAAATVVVLVAVSVVWFGLDIYADYVRQLTVLRHMILEDGSGVWHRMLSVFVAARRLGADVTTAYLVQAVAGAAAALAVAIVWRHDAASRGSRNAVLILGTCLATPYLQDYDLVFGTLAVACLWRDAERAEASPAFLFWASAAILVAPLAAAVLARATGFACGPLFVVPLFAIALKRGMATPTAVKPG
jgi:hypothetical protein